MIADWARCSSFCADDRAVIHHGNKSFKINGIHILLFLLPIFGCGRVQKGSIRFIVGTCRNRQVRVGRTTGERICDGCSVQIPSVSEFSRRCVTQNLACLFCAVP
jgi:hypothetical protein